MMHGFLRQLLSEMILEQALNCTFGGETSSSEIARFRIIQVIRQANKQTENSQ